MKRLKSYNNVNVYKQKTEVRFPALMNNNLINKLQESRNVYRYLILNTIVIRNILIL